MSSSDRRFGRYLELRRLAAGGMGEIVLAEHTGLSGFSKRVAVKRIRSALARDAAYIELFLNEARIGSFLNHPNIVHIFDVGRDDDLLWLVMEYVDGVDLKRLARRARRAGRPLPAPVVAAVALEVLTALDEAHHGGPLRGAPIIHRDLSPENVMIAKSGGVKVLDFGLAKWVPGHSSVPSMEGNMIFGKVRYMPPEQLRGELVDPRADLYALGVTLYETLRGDLPFGRGTASELLTRVLAGSPPPPTENHPRPDRALDAAVLKSLAAHPEHRYQSAAEMRDAFLAYLEGRPEPRLPLEVLRRIVGGLKTAPESSKPGTRTDMDLPVRVRCGKCGGDFSATMVDDLIVDRCVQCGGVWLEHDEVVRLVGPGRDRLAEAVAAPFQRAPLDSVVGTCPSDRSALRPYPVPGYPASFEVCSHCLGVWFDDAEVDLVRRGEVATWLRILLDTLTTGPPGPNYGP